MRSPPHAPSLALWCVFLALGVPAGAQSRSGSLTGSIVDVQGAPLPGVHLILAGGGAPQVQVTDASGEIRFLNLPPGRYRLTAALEGFSPVEIPNILIETHRETKVQITLLRAAQPPVADRRIAGADEQGPLRTYLDPGAARTTPGDDSAGGPPAGDTDLDAYREIASADGGGEIDLATGSGTNEWRGEGRFTFLRDGPGPVAERAPLQITDRLSRRQESGLEIGGPLLKDRLWIWGEYGRRSSDLRTASGPASPEGVASSAVITTRTLKLDAHLGASNSASLLAAHRDAQRRGLAAGPTRPRETSWDQSYIGREPTDFRLDDLHVFNARAYLEGLATVAENGVRFVPEAPPDATPSLDADEIWHGAFVLHQSERKDERLKADGSFDLDSGSARHELRLGAGESRADVRSLSTWTWGGLVYDGPAFFGSADDVLALSRAAKPSLVQQATSVYGQDTISRGDLTVRLGLRYDREQAENRQTSVPANPLIPELLPAATDGAGRAAPRWTSLSPRLSLSYALGSSRRTLLRAAWSRSPEPMSPEVAAWLNPLASQGYLYLSPDLPVFASPNVDPASGRLLQSNAVAAGLHSPRTDELLVSLDRALRRDLVVSLDLTYRRTADLLERELLVFDDPDPYCSACLGSVGRLDRRSDYESRAVTVLLPEGRQVTRPYDQLRPGVSTRLGSLLANGGGVQEVRGAALTLDKRLADRWMLRSRLAWADRRWNRVTDRADPTLTVPEALPLHGPRAGDAVVAGPDTDWLSADWSSGPFANSRWSCAIQGQVQIAPERPWGFDLLVGLRGREGAPVPYYVLVTLPANMQYERIRLQATDRPDSVRLDAVESLDLRLEKEIIHDDVRLTLGIDVFNATDRRTVLERQPRLDIGTSDHILMATLPRTFQVGARLAFR